MTRHQDQCRLGWAAGLGVTLALAGLAPCCTRADDRPRVVLYASVDDVVARPVLAEFERRSGIRVDLVTDSEASKTTGLVQRLLAERDRPQADVFWSSEVFMTIELASQGLLAEFLSETTTGWPRAWRDGQRRWHGMAARARVIVYATDRVAAETAPRTWQELADPRWRGRVIMADPRFGTTGGHLGAMAAYWTTVPELGPGAFERFIDELAANQVRAIPSGNAGVVRAVAAGEADLGLTDTDDVWAAQANGLRVDLVYPRHHPALPAPRGGAPGGGTLLIPNTVAKVRGGPNPAAADRLIDFLLSEDVERMLARSPSHNVPVAHASVGVESRYVVPDPLEVDLTAAARARPAAVELAVRRLMQDESAHAP